MVRFLTLEGLIRLYQLCLEYEMPPVHATEVHWLSGRILELFILASRL